PRTRPGAVQERCTEGPGADRAWCCTRQPRPPTHSKTLSPGSQMVLRLSISYCRSSGPGGQNVNKVNSKAEVRFHLASADWIPEDVRQKIAVMHKNKISKSGDLIINSEVSRYQMRNRADCLQKIRDMILEATEKPQVKRKETSEMLIARVEKMNRERLRQKKLRSAIKQDRSVDFD
uniref:Large ribosomal subunit protein mL62 n=1 Tax=Crocodylus porosus TaxID=8502 RepID=A0A7M4E5P5_CROPO